MENPTVSYKCELCNKNFSQNSSRNRHVREQHLHSGLYQCKECGKRFSKKYNFQIHKERMHSKNRKLKCSHCKVSFTNKATFNKHSVVHKNSPTNFISTNTALKTDAQTLAQSVLNELKQLQKEIQSSEEQCIVENEKGIIKFITIKDNLYPSGHFTLLKAKTIKRENGVKYFICEFCGKEFSKSYNYLRHQRIHTKVRPFICTFCKKCFPTTAQLKEHCTTHKLNEKFGLFHNLYNCPKCKEGFSSVQQLDNHLGSSGCNITFKCPQCLKPYKTLKKLLRHNHYEKDIELEMLKTILPTPLGVQTTLSKDNENYFECNYCGMQLNGKILLKQHKVRHENLFKNRCSKCQSCFATQTSLKIHNKIHLTSGNFKCRYCNKCFQTVRGCRKHMLNHLKLLINTNEYLENHNETVAVYPTYIENEENNQREATTTFVIKSSKKCTNQLTGKSFSVKQLKYKCSYCEKLFRYKAWLKKHFKYKHTSERTYECNVCFKKFRTKQCLDNHSLVHSANRVKLTCQVCGRQYASRKSLKVHLRIHTQETPFNCNDCVKTFRTSGHLIQHRKSNHKE